MAIPVQHKRSATPGAVPTTAALLAGQIALNTYDGRAFFKKSVSGTESIVELATTAAMAATYLPLTGGTLTGDLAISKASSPTTGTIYFGNSLGRYLTYDGSNFGLNGASLYLSDPLYVQGNLALHAGGGTINGNLSVNGVTSLIGGWEAVGADDLTSRVPGGSWQTTNARTTHGWPVTTNGWYHLLTSTHSNVYNYYSMQLAADFFSQHLFYRSTINNGAAAWSEIVHANNVGSFALPISGGVVNGAVKADHFVSWGSSSARGYAVMFAGDASHSGYISFNSAGGASQGYIGYCDSSQMTIATQYDADLAFYRNGVEKFRIGSGQSTIGALFLSGALTFCADAWNYSADGKNRLWFQTNGRSFYGSQDGHQFNTSSNALAGFLSDAGALMIAGNSMQIMTASTPVNGTTAGNAGEIRWDASYIYVCTAANTWKRAALSSF